MAPVDVGWTHKQDEYCNPRAHARRALKVTKLTEQVDVGNSTKDLSMICQAAVFLG